MAVHFVVAVMVIFAKQPLLHHLSNLHPNKLIHSTFYHRSQYKSKRETAMVIDNKRSMYVSNRLRERCYCCCCLVWSDHELRPCWSVRLGKSVRPDLNNLTDWSYRLARSLYRSDLTDLNWSYMTQFWSESGCSSPPTVLPQWSYSAPTKSKRCKAPTNNNNQHRAFSTANWAVPNNKKVRNATKAHIDQHSRVAPVPTSPPNLPPFN